MKNTNKQYASFLDQHKWTWFCTFTTAYKLTLKSSRRLMNRFFYSIKKSEEHNVRLFWVAEPNTVEGYHLHGLLYVPNSYQTQKNYNNIINNYQNVCGDNNWHRIELQRFDKEKNASSYCLKHIERAEKNNKGDYDIYI